MFFKYTLCFITLLPSALGQVANSATAGGTYDQVKCSDSSGASLDSTNLIVSPDVSPNSADTDGSSNPAVNGKSAPGYGQQTKRILWVVPNFNSVSAGTQLSPQSFKGKLMNATEDTFDYSNFIFIGAVSGIQQAQNSTPAFRQGGRGYGRYYWHSFVDQADENYFVESFMPILFRQDVRYYTLGRGGFMRRLVYAMSRAVITRSDTGAKEPNYSEIIGAGAAAGVSNLYYPEPERSWTKTGQRWVTSVGLDVMVDAFREFWPDINHKIFRK